VLAKRFNVGVDKPVWFEGELARKGEGSALSRSKLRPVSIEGSNLILF